MAGDQIPPSLEWAALRRYPVARLEYGKESIYG